MSRDQVKDGVVVTLAYSMKDPSGEILDSSDPEGPMIYLQGGDEMPDGFQEAMADHALGDGFSFELSPDDGWGERFDEAVMEVAADELGIEVELGDLVEAEDEDGDVVVFEVVEVREDGSVSLDGNHPLAGHTVTCEVEILALRPGTPEEIEAGEVVDEDEEEEEEED